MVETLEREAWVEEETPVRRLGPGRPPPREGPCKRCGQNRPLNRLFLCYACWVKTELEKRGWREGEPHPGGCGCDIPGSHSSGPQG